MSKDPRDEAKTETDQFGSMFYVSKNGKKIKVRDQEEAEKLRELEREAEFYHSFPMGMK